MKTPTKIMKYVWLIVFFLPAFSVAQDCNSIVYDQAGVLKGHEQEIQAAAQGVIDQGGDPKVATVLGATNLDLAEKQIEKSCQSWQSPNGDRKSTLLVLMVSPDTRKLGVYYGSAWKSALDSSWNRIKQSYMVPYFKNKDWSGGFVAAEEQFGKRLAASKDESLHPVQPATTV